MAKRNRLDLTGETFGDLTVIRLSHLQPSGRKNLAYWLCQCSCGNHVARRQERLRSGQSTHCGCLSSIKQSLTLAERNWSDCPIDTSSPVPACYQVAAQKYAYNPVTGDFAGPRGKAMQSKDAYGYIRFAVATPDRSNGKQTRGKVLAHRLAWYVMTGDYPHLDVDHKNGERADNSWSNLRLATKPQQARNTKRPDRDLPPGVYPTARGHFRARFWSDGHAVEVGTFATIEEAVSARRLAVNEAHGEFSIYQREAA